jgi:hypothetical protein
MNKVFIATLILFISYQSKAQDYKEYITILQSQWRLTDTTNDTTIFYKDTLMLTRKFTYKVAHHASFLFKEGGSLQIYFGCHTYSSDPDQEYCTPVFGQWEFLDPKNINLSFTDIGIYRSYKIENFSDEYITLVIKAP